MKNIIEKEVFGFDEVSYIAEVQVEYYVDKDYGADADGNRGEARLIIEDYKVLSIRDDAGRIVKDEISFKVLSEWLEITSEDLCER